jgi:hypothetical protein
VSDRISTKLAGGTQWDPAVVRHEINVYICFSRGQKLQQVSRILLLAERYISHIEHSFTEGRTLPPHATTFYGAPLSVRVISASAEKKREEATMLKSHRNERVADLKVRVAEVMKMQPDQIALSCNDLELSSERDSWFVGSLSKDSPLNLVAKTRSSTSTSSTSTALVLFQDSNVPSTSSASASASASAESSSESPGGANRTSRANRALSFCEEKEKTLPGVIMASGGQVFKMLYQVGQKSEGNKQFRLRSLSLDSFRTDHTGLFFGPIDDRSEA